MASLASPTTAGAANAANSGGHRCATQDAADAAAWAFYESGLVHGDGDEDGGAEDDEDTEDELETADWIRFQRARTHSRLLASRQQQNHLQQQQPPHRHPPQPQQPPATAPSETSQSSANSP